MRPRNETLDCLLLALAALRLSGVDVQRTGENKKTEHPAMQPGAVAVPGATGLGSNRRRVVARA